METVISGISLDKQFFAILHRSDSSRWLAEFHLRATRMSLAVVFSLDRHDSGGTFMIHNAGTRLDLLLAAICACCPLCRHARRKPDGLANRIVRKVEERMCPFCRAYARVARKAAGKIPPTSEGRG